jgi:hypothetical protein
VFCCLPKPFSFWHSEIETESRGGVWHSYSKTHVWREVFGTATWRHMVVGWCLPFRAVLAVIFAHHWHQLIGALPLRITGIRSPLRTMNFFLSSMVCSLWSGRVGAVLLNNGFKFCYSKFSIAVIFYSLHFQDISHHHHWSQMTH